MNGCGHLKNLKPKKAEHPLNYLNLEEVKACWVTYQGEFSNDLYNGYGTLTFTNGERFHGSFQKGKAHGTGYLTSYISILRTFYRNSGEIIPGQWQENRFVDKLFGKKA